MKKLSSTIQNEYFFLIPYGIWVFFSMFRVSLLFKYINPWYVPISLVCMGLLVVHEFSYLKKYNWKDYVGSIIALFLFATALMLKEGTVMYTILCIFVSRHISIKKIMITTLVAVTSMFLLTIVSSQLGIIEDYVAGHNGRNRHYLGFLYALIPSVIFTNIIAMYMYLRNKRILFVECIVLLSISFVIFHLTDSRLAFLTSILMVFGGYIIKWITKYIEKPWLLSVLLILLIISSPICTMLTTYYYNYENPVIAQVDDKLGHRFKKGYEAYKKYGLHLGINNIEFHGNGLTINGENETGYKDDYVDSFYLQYTLRYGLVFMGVILLMYIMTAIKLGIDNEVFALFFLMIFAINGIVTDQIFTLFYNAFLLFFARIFKRKESYNL